MVQRQRLMNYLKKFFDEISKRISLESAVLFGSMAVGKPGRDSDVDLIIVSSDFSGKNFYDRPAMLYAHWKINLPVDFICLTPREFKQKSQGVTIVSHALKHGVRIA